MPSERHSAQGGRQVRRPRGRPGGRPAGPFGSAGPPSRAELTDTLDRWLAGLLPPVSGVALVAVGSLGRREVVAHSDVDLVLLHNGVRQVGEIADSIWYPIWDAGVGLDHAVRTVDEAVAVARSDVRAALGLLDARYLGGDPALADELATTIRSAWRADPARRLADLQELTDARWRLAGELAFLLEPDLKEARGGTRDATTLRALAYAQLVDAPRGPVRAGYRLLLDVRDALHRSAGRSLDRLVLGEQDGVAHALGYLDADALLREVSAAARAIAHASDTAWRQVDDWLVRRRKWPARRRTAPARRPLADGVVEQDGEVVLARSLVPDDLTGDPVLPLRVAAAAATAGRPVARHTLERLAAASPALPPVWPEAAVRTLVTLLGAGPPAVDVWEAFDCHGLVERWLPEWGRVRSLPQRNPLHRFTVDRHLVETAAGAAVLTRRVQRPDLLLMAALLHDIGKGLPGDHAETGARIAERIARRWALPTGDREALTTLVRHHLLLADTATRRDLDDPATLRIVAEAVGGDPDLLDLLHALTEADGAATGPAVWSEWKATLVGDLVARVHLLLGDGTPPPVRSRPAEVLATVDPRPDRDDCVVRVDGDEVAVVGGPHVRALLSRAAGVLALHRLDVYAADAAMVGEHPVVVLRARPRFGDGPDPSLLTADLRRAVAGTLAVGAQLLRRETPAADAGPADVRWLHDAATDAAVLELRACDRRGLLRDVAAALEQAGATIRAARVSTFGDAVVDAFYLSGVGAGNDAHERLAEAVRQAADPRGAD